MNIAIILLNYTQKYFWVLVFYWNYIEHIEDLDTLKNIEFSYQEYTCFLLNLYTIYHRKTLKYIFI